MAAKTSGRIRHVLDSSSLLAVLQTETGGDEVADNIEYAVISALNVSECVATMTTNGVALSEAIKLVRMFQMVVEAFDEHAAIAAAALRLPTRKFGLSLGDRACLALAQKLNAPVMTADRIWSKLDLGIEIKLIR